MNWSSVPTLASILLLTLMGAQTEAAPKPTGRLRVAACQLLNGPDLSRNEDKILQWIERAAGQGVDVVSFPEACLPGYVQDKGYYAGLDRSALRHAEEAIIRASKRLDIAVVVGSVHWQEGTLYNSLLVIDKGGVVRGRYAKMYLAEAWPSPGKSLPIFSLAGVKSCFIICHDVRYPALVRLPAAAGARICYFCSHESGLTKEHKLSAYRAMPIARATENSIFLVMANAPASPVNLAGSHGNSKIVRPDGRVLLEAGYFQERLVMADLNLEEASGHIARKAVEHNRLLKPWFQQGLKLVTPGDPNRP